jgi:putative glutamine amidotransferase
MVRSSRSEDRATVLYTVYTDMVRHAGGVPVILTPGDATEAAGIVERIDGLVLTGGGDVDPLRYGGTPVDSVYDVDPARDEFEIGLVHAARERSLPTLAICRGTQVLNVALGGTLIEDIGRWDPDALHHWIDGTGATVPQHGIDLAADSILASALGVTELEVNTIHHQAIGRLGDGLRSAGTAPDGIVEAIESDDAAWPMWGVQWHPEYLGVDDPAALGLFQTLIAAAGR